MTEQHSSLEPQASALDTAFASDAMMGETSLAARFVQLCDE